MKTANIEVTLLDHMGSDLSVANAARVSFHKESDWEYECTRCGQASDYAAWCVECDGDENGGTDPYAMKVRLSDRDAKLITYLAKHNHKSPFNHAFLSFRVKAPIFVARQLVKHKFLPWNEVSRRYVDDEPEFYFPETYRAKAANVKQGSSDEAITSIIARDPYSDGACYGSEVDSYTEYVCEGTFIAYQCLLNNGVCPEQARMVLPQNTMTEWIWSGSLGAFADMCKLRLDSHAQKESRDVAELIAKEMRNLFPVSFEALLSV